jgi:hypothetical protein
MISELQNHYLLLSRVYLRWSVLFKYICCNSLHIRIGFGSSMGFSPDQVEYTITLVGSIAKNMSERGDCCFSELVQ